MIIQISYVNTMSRAHLADIFMALGREHDLHMEVLCMPSADDIQKFLREKPDCHMILLNEKLVEFIPNLRDHRMVAIDLDTTAALNEEQIAEILAVVLNQFQSGKFNDAALNVPPEVVKTEKEKKREMKKAAKKAAR